MSDGVARTTRSVLEDLQDRSEVLMVDETGVFPLTDRSAGARRRLAGEIYRWSHLRSDQDGPAHDHVADAQVVRAVAKDLDHHRASSGPWHAGPDAETVLSPEGVLVAGDAFPTDTEDHTRRLLPAVLPNRSPGHISVVGSRGARRPGTRGVLRVYLAAPPSDALRVLVDLSRAFERQRLRYSGKALAATDAAPRSDSVVGYVDLEDHDAASVVASVGAAVGDLDPATDPSRFVSAGGPACGVVRDDEPSAAVGSLGQRISRQVADALLTAVDEDGTDLDEVVARGAAHLVDHVPGDDRSWLSALTAAAP